MNLRNLYLTIMIIVLFGCTKLPSGDDDTTPPPPVYIPVATVEIKELLVTLNPGDTARLTAVAKDVNGDIMDDKSFAWSVSDTGIASVNKGLITCKAIGRVTIRAIVEGITGSLELLVGRAIEVAYVNVPVGYGANVPDAAKQKVQVFSSVLDAVKPAASAKLPLFKDRTSNMAFALDDKGEIMLFGIFIGKGHIELDATSTALGLVRFALNPAGTGALTPAQLNAQISSAPSFAQTVAAVQEQLDKGLPLFSTGKSAQSAAKVAGEIIVKNNGQVAGRTTADDKHYFIDEIWKGENLWFEDKTGPWVTVKNDTRLDWMVTTYKDNKQIEHKQAEWLPFKFEEFITALNPPTETQMAVVTDLYNTGKFSIKVEQNETTQGKHAVNFIQMLGIVIIEAISTYDGTLKENEQCALQFAQNIVNDNLPALLTRADGKAVLEYLKGIVKGLTADALLTKLDKCQTRVSVAKWYKPFIKSIATIWNEVQFAVAAGTAGEFVYQMVKYWKFSKTISACKINGVLGTCDRAITKQGGDGQVCNPGMTANHTFDILLTDKANQKPLANEAVVFTRQGPDGQTVDFPAISNQAGIASCDGCYIGEKEGDYTFTCKSVIDPNPVASFTVKGKYIFRITSTRHETTEGLVVKSDPANVYISPGYMFYANVESDSAYWKDNIMYAFYWGGDTYLQMSVFSSGTTRLDDESKLLNIIPISSKIQSADPFKGEIYLNGYPSKKKDGSPTAGKAFEFVILYNGYKLSKTVRFF